MEILSVELILDFCIRYWCMMLLWILDMGLVVLLLFFVFDVGEEWGLLLRVFGMVVLFRELCLWWWLLVLDLRLWLVGEEKIFFRFGLLRMILFWRMVLFFLMYLFRLRWMILRLIFLLWLFVLVVLGLLNFWSILNFIGYFIRLLFWLMLMWIEKIWV